MTVATAVGSAFLVVLLATPVARGLARRWGLLDRPVGYKTHSRATPLLGGAAITLALAGVALAYGGMGAVVPVAAAVLMFAVGLLDDRRGLGVGAKLAAQLVVATIVILAGWRLELPLPTVLPPALAAALAAGLTMIWIVGMINACNLLDNMDGVLASVAAVASAGFLLLLPAGSTASMLAAVSLGATAAFLIYNAPPASIFMGDAGSFPLGLWLALLGLELAAAAPRASWSWLPPMLVLAVPLADTILVSISRLRRGRNPLTTPGNDHLSHRLRARGAGDRGTVLLLVLAGAAGSALAWLARAM